MSRCFVIVEDLRRGLDLEGESVRAHSALGMDIDYCLFRTLSLAFRSLVLYSLLLPSSFRLLHASCSVVPAVLIGLNIIYLTCSLGTRVQLSTRGYSFLNTKTILCLQGTKVKSTLG